MFIFITYQLSTAIEQLNQAYPKYKKQKFVKVFNSTLFGMNYYYMYLASLKQVSYLHKITFAIH